MALSADRIALYAAAAALGAPALWSTSRARRSNSMASLILVGLAAFIVIL
jgi:hypothetical protein